MTSFNIRPQLPLRPPQKQRPRLRLRLPHRCRRGRGQHRQCS